MCSYLSFYANTPVSRVVLSILNLGYPGYVADIRGHSAMAVAPSFGENNRTNKLNLTDYDIYLKIIYDDDQHYGSRS